MIWDNRTGDAHLISAGLTYQQHSHRALSFGFRMIGAGLACLIHAVCPWLFITTASRTVSELYHEMRQ